MSYAIMTARPCAAGRHAGSERALPGKGRVVGCWPSCPPEAMSPFALRRGRAAPPVQLTIAWPAEAVGIGWPLPKWPAANAPTH